ncbi:type II secretion system F family protein [Candidatus Bathyarchaeota archaeon]|nr:type II secretion system F family protein [Candidatus Bathyarchaeota archaeon]
MRFEKRYSKGAKLVVCILSAIVGVITLFIGYLLVGLSYKFRLYIGLAIALSLLAPSLIVYWEDGWRKKIEDALPKLLDDLADCHEVGMPLFQALETCSKRNYGPITEELKKLAAKISFAANFEKAFMDFSERIGSDLLSRVTTIIIEAMRAGGDIKAVFRSTAKFVREMVILRNERESRLRPHLIIVYITVLVFIAVMVLLYNSIFTMIKTSFGYFGPPISLEEFKALFFDLVMMESIFSGLIAGKITQGRILAGLIHSTVLIFVATIILAFYLF